MQRALRAYRAVLRLVRCLPKDSRPYYSKYARENFVNYREVDNVNLEELFRRTYDHATWVLKKYSVDQAATATLKEICRS
ncbi:LYR motif-containing protein At3g19508-like [Tasmannia lanceolata]|uniref:LYR motif-containing protein At3g19508-like n=1 Tax=Tasmannia lanceolata TaxID=3420 RepID=UPI004063146E